MGNWQDGGRLSGSYTSSTVIPMLPIIPMVQGPCVGGLIGTWNPYDGDIFANTLPSFWNASVNPEYVPNITFPRNHLRDVFRAIGNLQFSNSYYPHASALASTTEGLRNSETFDNADFQWDLLQTWEFREGENDGFLVHQM